MRKEHLDIARALYHPTEEVESLVLKMIDLFDKPLSNGVVVNGLRFDDSHLKIGDLTVQWVCRVKNHCGIEIHWYPNYKISTKNDPFCSAFVLTESELSTIYREVKKALSTMRAK